MILSKQIIEFGLDENYIRYFHSKTKLSQFTIEGVEYVRGTSDTILIRLQLVLYLHGKRRQTSLEID
jgi:hypothetical protein